MLARLEAAFASQRRFIAHASHELRTPLSEMRTLIDVTLARRAVSAGQLEPVMAEIGAALDKSDGGLDVQVRLPATAHESHHKPILADHRPQLPLASGGAASSLLPPGR